MSFSVSVQGSKAELAGKAEDAFANAYPEPNPGVEDLFSVGLTTIHNFELSSGSDTGDYNAVISGHAKNPDSPFRDSLSVSINPMD